MSDSIDSSDVLKRKINSASDLHSVVRSMKAMAAANVGQYENAVEALNDYYRTVQLGLFTCFHQYQPVPDLQPRKACIGVLVFGSDQGLVGQFNDLLADFVLATLGKRPEQKIVYCIGERLQSRLSESTLNLAAGFILPKSINAIPPLIGEMLLKMESLRAQGQISEVIIFHNKPVSRTIYQPFSHRLLPLDDIWQKDLQSITWPSNSLPEVINASEETLLAFIHEYLFVSLYRACAESLASENASRLSTMLRAEKTINELVEVMKGRFHLLRQNSIDEELFDLIAGFELFKKSDY
ncbi:ATP synthase F1, H+-transporting two-sector ATPase gamma subunit [Psychromonas ingrahamii 37]|uniref:ATP synthase F1, H+-transporting two-sector ATPase gamma subunit n=1 Tax=Psychromonas ingrahamii (strain DSM 17664 / CCUG 51855 / 37) TaxID=357804 RepID=A1SS63_PSYIN|nr:F0F1 ATP synthase subunit gamma [Psychromonas ingrahamii]ABM02328.1 ATP synthase F1, H+-transporting two-sector ATPase gamma subunit [Psychromonas ingrahamii 37]